eukprot:1325852-Amorphochlora_amoeboformis.AAC.1
MNEAKLKKLKVKQLRKELKKRGLDTKGLKAVLLQRLIEAVKAEGEQKDEDQPNKEIHSDAAMKTDPVDEKRGEEKQEEPSANTTEVQAADGDAGEGAGDEGDNGGQNSDELQRAAEEEREKEQKLRDEASEVAVEVQETATNEGENGVDRQEISQRGDEEGKQSKQNEKDCFDRRGDRISNLNFIARRDEGSNVAVESSVQVTGGEKGMEVEDKPRGDSQEGGDRVKESNQKKM